MLNDSIDNLRIDLNRKKIQQSVSVRYKDTKTRSIHVSITNNGLLYKLNNILFAEIMILKADGTETDQSMVISGDELQYTFRTQDVSAIGQNRCQVKLTGKDGSIVTTPEFDLIVYNQLVDQDKLESTNEYTSITQQVSIANMLAEEAKRASESAQKNKESIDGSLEEIATYAQEAVNAAGIAAQKADIATNAATTSVRNSDIAENAADSANRKLLEINSVASNVNALSENAYYEAERSKNYSDETKRLYQNFVSEVNKGSFKGDKGDQGIQGVQGQQGIQGPKGDKGDPGESGIVAPVNGFYTLFVDENGDLYVETNDPETTPDFYFNEETGDLFISFNNNLVQGG